MRRWVFAINNATGDTLPDFNITVNARAHIISAITWDEVVQIGFPIVSTHYISC